MASSNFADRDKSYFHGNPFCCGKNARLESRNLTQAYGLQKGHVVRILGNKNFSRDQRILNFDSNYMLNSSKSARIELLSKSIKNISSSGGRFLIFS